MTDCRTTDLIYGHPGLANYDIDTKIWSFSSPYEEDLYVEQVEPPIEILPPCIEETSTSDEIPSVIIRRQSNTLFKALPELYSSKDLITTLLQSQFDQVSTLFNGTNFVVGHAKDTKKISGSRRPLIFASTYGSAAHTLQLLMPRYEICRWEKCTKTRLSLLGNSIVDRAFWTNGKGTIRQISFPDTLVEKSTWLATRQDSIITVFRPFLRDESSYSWTANTSLHPNPVAIISCGEDINFVYSDISFNPWYPRQLAIINSRGCWSIYELEKSHRKGPFQRVRQKITGDFYDFCNLMATSESKSSCPADGWHRILWICNINTMVICNRSYLAIFDIKSTIVKLQTPTLIAKGSEDCILDVKRSPLNSGELFVLTTSRILWMQVIPSKLTPQDENCLFGGKIILSCRHFRSPSDDSLNIVPVTAGKVSLLLTSAKHPVISFYYFGREAGDSSYSKALQGFLNLRCIPGINSLIVSACFLPCTFIFNPSDDNSNSEAQSSNEGIEFYQLWFLTPTLQLVSTLCAVRLLHTYDILSPIAQIKLPDKKNKKIPNRMNRRLTEDSFIVPDELKYDKLETNCAQENKNSSVGDEKTYKDLRFRLDWRSLFQKLFYFECKEGDAAVGPYGCKIQTTAQFLSKVSDQIKKGLKDKSMILIYDICDFDPVSEDLRQVETIIKDYFDHLDMYSDIKNPKCLSLKQISLFGGIGLAFELGEALDLSHIFHQLIEIWISVLPKDVPNRFRGVRLRLVRKLALDLYMSSIGLFFEKKIPSHQSSQLIDSQELSQPGISEKDISRTSSVTSCQKATGQKYGEAENQYHISSTTKSDDSEILLAPETSSEDPAFSRIRQFAASVKSSSKFKRPIFLNDWSSTPGCDPDIVYSYEDVYNFSIRARSDDEKNSREESQRRRKANKSLSQQRIRSHQSVSQPVSVIRDSTAEIPASQTSINFNDIVNTNKKRRPKKQRTAGF